MEVQIKITEYIELLEFKVDLLEREEAIDSSWNYGIVELKEKIKKLKSLLV